MNWIPISADEKPALKDEILVFTRGKTIRLESGYHLHDMMTAAVLDNEPCYITHWMPLPSPPECMEPRLP